MQEVLVSDRADHNPHPIHPWYGPCDAMAPGGHCAACIEYVRALEGAKEEMQAHIDKLEKTSD